jgi:hypothetical protein
MNNDLGWWFIHGDEIMEALNKVYDGELPDIAYAELYANSEVNEVEVLDAEEI